MPKIDVPRSARAAIAYTLPIVIPLLIPRWIQNPPAVSPFFLCVAVTARLFGFGPALACTIVSTFSFWAGILSDEPYPLHTQFARLGLFVLAAVVVASVSRQRSREAREAEERYRSLVELAPDGIVVTDEAGTIVFANSALARIVGASDPHTLIGRSSLDFVHPDDRALARQRIGQLMEGRATTWVASRAVRVDGTPVLVERAGVPMRKGNEHFAQGFVRDLTQHMESEAQLDASRRRLQALFDGALDAILFYDSDGRCIDANPAAATLLGSTREEITNKRIGEIPQPRVLATILAAGQSTGEASILDAEGVKRDVEYRRVTDVLPGLHVLLMHDITKSKEAQRAVRDLSARLLRAQDAEQRRLAKMLHDTTAQDLAAIRLGLASIHRSPSVVDPQLKGLVRESMDDTERVISQIRTLAYLLHPPLIEEAGLVAALQWYAAGFETRSAIKVELTLPENLRLPPEIETALFRIVQEALTNIQRHAESAVARIRIAEETGGIHLQIADEGKGLSIEYRQNPDALFASGVGVAAMRERVSELGGELRIESAGRGTEIDVTLPIPH